METNPERPVLPTFIIESKNATAEIMQRRLDDLDMMTWEVRDKKHQDTLTMKQFFELIQGKTTRNKFNFVDTDTKELMLDFILTLPDRLGSIQKLIRNEMEDFISSNEQLAEYAIDADYYVKLKDQNEEILTNELALLKKNQAEIDKLKLSLCTDKDFLLKLKDELETLHVKGGEIMKPESPPPPKFKRKPQKQDEDDEEEF